MSSPMDKPEKGESDKLKLVDVGQLELLINDAVLDEPQKEYLRKRWLHQIRWWDKRTWEARRRYFRLRVTIVLGGVLLPFLTTTSLGGLWAQRLAAIVSLLVAASAALEALYGWGSIWLEKRRAAEVLKAEGWVFLYGGGVYRDHPQKETFADFVTEVESQISAEVGEYVAVTRKAQESQTQPGRSSEPKAESDAQSTGLPKRLTGN
jgi:hypothetical protein